MKKKQGRPGLPEETKAQAVELRKQGKAYNVIARKLNIHPQTVYLLCKKAGVPSKRQAKQEAEQRAVYKEILKQCSAHARRLKQEVKQEVEAKPTQSLQSELKQELKKQLDQDTDKRIIDTLRQTIERLVREVQANEERNADLVRQLDDLQEAFNKEKNKTWLDRLIGF